MSELEKLFPELVELMKLKEVFPQVIQEISSNVQQYKGDMQTIVESTKKFKDEISKLNSSTKEGQESIEKLTKTVDQNAQTYNNLKGSVVALEGTIDDLTKEQDDFNKKADEAIQINKERLKLERKLADLSSEEAEEIAKLKVQIQERNKALREQAKETLGVVKVQSKFSKNQDRIADALENTGGAAGNAIGGVKGLGAQFKALLANPIVAVIAAIAGLLVVLFDRFKKTAVGAELFAKAGAFVEGLLSSLTGIVNNLIPLFSSVFEDPLGAIKEFGNFLLQNIINRFKGLISLGQTLGKLIGQLLSGEFDKLADTAKEAGQAFIQFQTGLDVEQQEAFAEGLAKIATEAVNTANAFVKLVEAQRAVRRENRRLSVEVERLAGREEELQVIADDATKSFAEREAAAEKARIALEKRSEAEVRIAQNTLRLLNQEVSLRRANGEEIEDLLDQQADAQKALIAAQSALTVAVRDNEKTRAELVQDRLERDLDILIDGFDNQKTINERRIADDRKTLDERRALLDETATLAEDSFNKQIETIQKFTDANVDANDLIATSDAVALNEKIRSLGLSEIIEGRLLEVIRERRIVTEDLAEAERDLNEAALQARQELTQSELELSIARKDAEAEFGNDRINAIKERTQLEIKLEEEKSEALIAQEGLTEEEREQIRAESEQRITEIARRGLDDRINLLQEELTSFTNFLGSVESLFQAFGERRTIREDERLAKLEEDNARLLENENLTTDQREALEKSLDAERERVTRQQARRQRRLAIFNKGVSLAQVTIDGVAAIAKAAAALPFPANLPGIVAETIRSGINVATVAATPIPAFATGTLNAPGGPALVGEKGRELVIEPSGKISLTGNKAELRDIPQGSAILTNAITERILSGVSEAVRNERSARNIQKVMQNERSQIMTTQIKSMLKSENQELVTAIKSIIPTVHQWFMTDGDLKHNAVKGLTTYKNVQERNNY